MSHQGLSWQYYKLDAVFTINYLLKKASCCNLWFEWRHRREAIWVSGSVVFVVFFMYSQMKDKEKIFQWNELEPFESRSSSNLYHFELLSSGLADDISVCEFSGSNGFEMVLGGGGSRDGCNESEEENDELHFYCFDLLWWFDDSDANSGCLNTPRLWRYKVTTCCAFQKSG